MNIKDTILRQYGNSTKIKSIVYSFNSGIRVEEKIDEFYNKVLNLDTANSYGLDCWGKIVGVSRYVKFDDISDSFGFYGTGLKPFNQGTFYSGKVSTKTLRLYDNFYRALIKAKATANISDVTISSMNRLINLIYPEKGKAFVTDNGDMTLNYVFPYYLTNAQISLIKNSNIIPLPSGVRTRAIIFTPSKTFGFYGTGLQPFNQGTFFSHRRIINVD